MSCFKKRFCVFLSFVMLCGLLSGCVGMKVETSINEDGSGSLTFVEGVSLEAVRSIYAEQDGKNYSDAEIVALIKENGGDEAGEIVHIDGAKFFGTSTTASFTNISELDAAFEKAAEESGGEVSEGKSFSDMFMLSQKDDGFYLSVDMDTSEAPEPWVETSDLPVDEQMNVEIEGMDEVASVMEESTVMLFVYNFPYPVTKLSGTTDGITIVGNKLTMDAMKMQKDVDLKWEFFAGNTVPVSGLKKDVVFSDVCVGDWFYKPVTACANAGFVEGFGNGKFGPNDTLTVAQFCQILSRAKGLEVGTGESGYWAEKAITHCVSNGWIPSHGAFTAKNYNVKILREEAIAAMQRASGKPATGFYTASDIPDYNKIADEFKADLLSALNSGVVSGYDDAHTMGPKNSLTRAQICQLFFNAGFVV